MFSRSTIFLGLMLTGSLAVASLMREEESHVVDIVLPAVRVASYKSIDDKRAVLPTLQLDKLKRAETAEPERNPFAGKSWYVPPPALPSPIIVAVPKEVERPSAPSLPFSYMGQIQEQGERAVVFLTQGTRAYSVRAGEDIDDLYRLESVSPTRLVLVYLPLNIRQALSIQSAMASETESVTGTNEESPSLLANTPLQGAAAEHTLGSMQ